MGRPGPPSAVGMHLTEAGCAVSPKPSRALGSGAKRVIWLVSNTKGVLNTSLPIGLGNKIARSDNSCGLFAPGSGRERMSGPAHSSVWASATCPRLSPGFLPPDGWGDAMILGARSGLGGRGRGPLREMGEDPGRGRAPGRHREDPFLRAVLEGKREPPSLVLSSLVYLKKGKRKKKKKKACGLTPTEPGT